jgi:hypothetical protein
MKWSWPNLRCTIPAFPGGTAENHKKTSLRISSAWVSQIQSRSVNLLTITFGVCEILHTILKTTFTGNLLHHVKYRLKC